MRNLFRQILLVDVIIMSVRLLELDSVVWKKMK